jgi:DNA-binding PadR family transcriptional regulator
MKAELESKVAQGLLQRTMTKQGDIVYTITPAGELWVHEHIVIPREARERWLQVQGLTS